MNFNINHIALPVKDLERSCEFYRKVLDLQEIPNRAESPTIRWFSLGDGKQLHLIAGIPGQVTVTIAVHFALSTPRFDDFLQKLNAIQIHYTDWAGKSQAINIRADGVRQIYFQDLDGNWIEVNDAG